MGAWVAALGIIVCMLTSGLFVGAAPTRRRAVLVTGLGVLASLALWLLIALGIGISGTLPTIVLSVLLIALTATELSAGLRRRVGSA